MRKILILFLILCFAQISGYCAKIDIQSKHQSIDVDKNKGVFTGDVQVQIGDVIVKSPKADLDLDPATKKPSIATFIENPYSFQEKGSKKHEIKAQIIKVSLLKKTLFASGNSQTIILEDREPVIILNADSQEYDTTTNIMKANGAVIINHTDLETISDKAEAYIDKTGDIRNVKLFGHVTMKQKGNIIKGDKFSFKDLNSIFTIEGNTSSDVVFEDGTKVFVKADTQQFDRRTNTMIASGHIQINYKDYVAQGPKAHMLVDKATNKPDKIIFTGRSKITQNDSTIEADRIELIIEPKGFKADGNVKTSITTSDDEEDMEFIK
ncbi:hypothetical protein IKA92_02055 [bacterium]|nr:hypothetical protein [bacterium]